MCFCVIISFGYLTIVAIFWQVRDRATLYLNTLGGDGAVVETDEEVKEFLFGSLGVPLTNLETSLKNYVCSFSILQSLVLFAFVI